MMLRGERDAEGGGHLQLACNQAAISKASVMMRGERDAEGGGHSTATTR